MDIEDEKSVFSFFARLCSTREVAKSDVLGKMSRKGVPESVAESVMERLESEGYVSHERFASAFAESHLRFQHWGTVKIRLALRQKNIPESTIDAAINALDKEEMAQVLHTIIAAKRRTLTAKTPYEERTKLLRFALSRGFTMDEVLAAL